jgi:hypothetical protein
MATILVDEEALVRAIGAEVLEFVLEHSPETVSQAQAECWAPIVARGALRRLMDGVQTEPSQGSLRVP